MRGQRSKTTVLKGGLNLEAGPLDSNLGNLLVCRNFTAKLGGGYRRVGGFERIDGQLAPSDGVFYAVAISNISNFSVGMTIEGVDSGATGEIIAIDEESSTIAFAVTAGTFELDEVIQQSGV